MANRCIGEQGRNMGDFGKMRSEPKGTCEQKKLASVEGVCVDKEKRDLDVGVSVSATQE